MHFLQHKLVYALCSALSFSLHKFTEISRGIQFFVVFVFVFSIWNSHEFTSIYYNRINKSTLLLFNPICFLRIFSSIQQMTKNGGKKNCRIANGIVLDIPVYFSLFCFAQANRIQSIGIPFIVVACHIEFHSRKYPLRVALPLESGTIFVLEFFVTLTISLRR